MPERTLQIIPANGVEAVFKEKDGSETSYPIVCWRLFRAWDEDEKETEADGRDFVTGMILVGGTPYLADVVGWEVSSGFLEYRYN